jgi:hypothetical protein
MKNLKISMTGQDIKNYLPNCKMIEYNDLAEYNNINDLLTKPIDYVIILIETIADNVGHWVAVLRYGNTIEFFNSYGEAPDVQKNTLISKAKNIEFGQTQNYLTNLLVKSNFNIIYNKLQLQKYSNGSTTCGRFCVLRILCLLNHNMDLKQFLEFMMDLKAKLTNKSFDQIVCMIIY